MNIPIRQLREIYITMLKIRRFEEKVGELVSSGQIKTPCHLYIGQEAIATGVCAALRKGDSVFSSHRSHGHFIAKGGSIKQLMAELFCRQTGCCKGRGGSMHLADKGNGLFGSSAIVAGSIPLSVGSALVFSLQNKKNVSVVFFGDGATHEGVFYESLNFAGLMKLPVIFVCENNLYCTHMPISSCLADTQIYKKAEIFNMPGVQVDGNNAIEVFRKTKELAQRARNRCGPALLECMTYRWRGHVGPNVDLDKGLRSRRELQSWMDKCPIKRIEKILFVKGALSARQKENIAGQIADEIESAVKYAKGSPYPDKEALFTGVFK